MKINLICLPFAGGNKYSYRKFNEILPPFLHFVPVEYPGHGSRTREPLITDIHEMSIDVFNQIKDVIMQGDYALYGHSMGGIVGFELIHNIIKAGLKLPLHFFITGTVGPSSSKRVDRKWHELSRIDFMNKLKELDGCPSELFSDTDLFDYFDPIIRADFMSISNYKYIKRSPLLIPLTVITGSEERMEEIDIRLWENESKYAVNFHKTDGKHFFIFEKADFIIQTISQNLEKTIAFFTN